MPIVRPAIQHDILHERAQHRIELIVNAELAGIDDAHRQAGAYRVVQKHRVDRLADGVVAAKAEADVRDAARHFRVRQVLANPRRRADEVDGVVRVLVDAGRDREHVRVDDDVLGREPDAIDEQVVRAACHLDPTLIAVRLTALVEAHDDGRGAIVPDELGLTQKLGLAFLHRDRVDDGLSLNAFETGFDDVPLRRVDHHRHARDVRLGRDQAQEANHRRLRVEHRLVHVDVDHLRAVLHLLARDFDGSGVIAAEDQLRECARAGDVRPFANVDEQRTLIDVERL